MRLKHWSDEIREAFNQKLVRNNNVTASLKATLAEMPEAHQYEYPTVLAYTRSSQGVEDRKAAQKTLAKTAKGTFLATGGGRLDTLVEVATDLMGRFRTAPDSKEATTLATEIRNTIREIRQEVDPLGLENDGTRSHFEKLLGSFNQLASDDKDRIMAISEATWKSQPTVEN